MYALYSRHNYTSDDVKVLVSPLYEPGTIDVLRRLYTWSVVSADDLDDEKYLLCKKLSEVSIPSLIEAKAKLSAVDSHCGKILASETGLSVKYHGRA